MNTCRFFTAGGAVDTSRTFSFCDPFDEKFLGGRNGELNDERWSFARLGQTTNPTQGSVSTWMPVDRQFCLITDPNDPRNANKLPPEDSFFCGPEFIDPVLGGPESMHWMEAFYDNEDYAYNSARISQPFDFAGRQGTFSFVVDAKNGGSHGWWVEVWLTEDPETGPHNLNPSTVARPKNGIGLRLFDTCGGANNEKTNLGQLIVVRNYIESEHPFQTPSNGCILTKVDRHNHLEVRISQNELELWGNDHGVDGTPGNPRHESFRMMASADNINLPFTRGYWHVQHAQYNAAKFACNNPTCAHQTYHWDNIGFDGPVLPMLRVYSHPDAGMPSRDGGLNLGWTLDTNGASKCCATSGSEWVPQPNFQFPNVNINDATRGWLSFNFQPIYDGDVAGYRVRYRLNGGAWKTWSHPNPGTGGGWRAMLIPLILSDLRSGINTLEMTSVAGENTSLANIDLIVEGPSTGVTAALTPTRTPTPFPPTNTPTPKKLGDVDGSGVVDIYDFNELIAHFGEVGQNIASDLDSSGEVDINDFNEVVANFSP